MFALRQGGLGAALGPYKEPFAHPDCYPVFNDPCLCEESPNLQLLLHAKDDSRTQLLVQAVHPEHDEAPEGQLGEAEAGMDEGPRAQ